MANLFCTHCKQLEPVIVSEEVSAGKKVTISKCTICNTIIAVVIG